MTEVQEKVRLAPKDTEPTRMSHWIDRRISGNDETVAAILGREVIALCGHRFIPSRDPLRLPVCPTCYEIAERLKAERLG